MIYRLSFVKRLIVLGSLLCITLSSGVFALTPKAEKGVKTLRAPSIVSDSPEWFTPFSLDKAPTDINYWTSILPYPEDKAEEMYVVMPTLWLIVPVVFIPQWTADFLAMAGWQQIDINKYLVEGAMNYPTSGKPWQVGNSVIFWHSNFYLQGAGKYKTIFADIMNLDVGPYDEIWIYTRQADGTYKQQRFAIERSYETVPTDVEILLPLGGKELTVFACTNGLAGRWILRSRLIEDDEILISYPMRWKLYELLKQLKEKSPERQKVIATIVVTRINEILWTIPAETESYQLKFKKYVLQYVQRELVKFY